MLPTILDAMLTKKAISDAFSFNLALKTKPTISAKLETTTNGKL